jgi:uncharacterized membrane protein YidH (DUF202 family)
VRKTAALVGIVVGTFGLIGVVAPDRLLRTASALLSPGAIYAVAALRLAFGLAILLVAGRSRAPIALRVLGVLFLLSGVVTMSIGVERARGMIEWARAQDTTAIRLGATVAVMVGAFIVYSVVPARSAQARRSDPSPREDR